MGDQNRPFFQARTAGRESLVADECRRLLDVLDDDTLRSVAIWKLEGYTNHEIAGKLQCVDQTVERKLRTIRSIWAREART